MSKDQNEQAAPTDASLDERMKEEVVDTLPTESSSGTSEYRVSLAKKSGSAKYPGNIRVCVRALDPSEAQKKVEVAYPVDKYRILRIKAIR